MKCIAQFLGRSNAICTDDAGAATTNIPFDIRTLVRLLNETCPVYWNVCLVGHMGLRATLSFAQGKLRTEKRITTGEIHAN